LTSEPSLSAAVVEYRLTAWPPDARAALDALVRGACVDARWEGASLFVPVERRADVDQLIASLNAIPPSPPPSPAPAAPRAAPAGWYPDPWRAGPWRWWDGTDWGNLAPTADAIAERPWFPRRNDREHGIRGGGLVLAGFFGGEALGLGIALGLVALGVSRHSLIVLCAGQAGLWTGLFGACVLAVRRHGTGSLRDLGLSRITPRDAGIGALASLVGRVGTALIAAALYLLFFRGKSITNNTSLTAVTHPSVATKIVIGLIVVVGAPFFEELFFRGLVQGVLTRRWGAQVALFTQAVGFALVHYQIGMSLAQAVLVWAEIGAFGFLLGCLRWRYERLAPGMVAHALFNALAVAVLFATA
jgi:membrane protease YdiL (CAAX protease family)